MPTTLIDVKELSERLSISTGTIYNWVSQAERGRGPLKNGKGYRKIGRCVRFDWDEIAGQTTIVEASKR